MAKWNENGYKFEPGTVCITPENRNGTKKYANPGFSRIIPYIFGDYSYYCRRNAGYCYINR